MENISVIIPVYNTGQYLERCLTSILTQSLREIEVIVVNDGSTDNSLEIINKFKERDKRIKVIDKKNGGLSSARNAGIDQARGEYILHIDSDDWIEQDYFYRVYSYAKDNSLDVVVTDFYTDYDNGEINYTRDIKIIENKFINGKKYLEKFFFGEGYPAVWNKLFKADLYKVTGIRHPFEVSLGEDLGTTPILINKANKIGKINEAYVHYIQNPKSITKSGKLKKINELFLVLEKIKEELGSSVENSYLNGLIINNLGNIFYTEEFIKDYKKEAMKFLDLIKETPNIKTKSIKNKLFFKVLKKFPNLYVLNSIKKINLLLLKKFF